MPKNLIEEVELKHGAKLKNRIVMAPMLVMGCTDDGRVTPEVLDYYSYYSLRSNVAGMIITSAAYIQENAKGMPNALAAYKDEDIEGLSKLAAAIKKDGSKAILQIYHTGREALVAHEELGEAVAPSALDFPFLDYSPRALTNTEIEEIIENFGLATKRAIEAGFDGVEIHGANHYLIQQFFSKYSNRRNDKWGGSLENRMRFPLRVVEEVKTVVEAYADDDFIIGYRISPEEIHDENIGYKVEAALALIKEVLDYDLDYIHLSLFGSTALKPQDREESFAELFEDLIQKEDPDSKLIVVGGVFNEEDAKKGIKYADLVAIGRAALLDPEFALKISQGRADEINQALSPELHKKLAWPQQLTDLFKSGFPGLPEMPGIDTI